MASNVHEPPDFTPYITVRFGSSTKLMWGFCEKSNASDERPMNPIGLAPVTTTVSTVVAAGAVIGPNAASRREHESNTLDMDKAVTFMSWTSVFPLRVHNCAVFRPAPSDSTVRRRTVALGLLGETTSAWEAYAECEGGRLGAKEEVA